MCVGFGFALLLVTLKSVLVKSVSMKKLGMSFVCHIKFCVCLLAFKRNTIKTCLLFWFLSLYPGKVFLLL